MKIYKIEIERFLGIRDLSIEISSGLQIIAGSNNSGKTTIMKALDFFFSLAEENVLPEKFAPKNNYYKTEGGRSLTRIKVYFNDLTSYEKTKFTDVYSSQSKSFWAELKISRKGSVEFRAPQNRGSLSFHKKVLSCYYVYHVPVLRVGTLGMSDNENQRLMATVRDTLVKRRPGPKTKLQKDFLKAFNRLDKLIKSVLEHSEDYASTILPSDTDLSFSLPREEEVLFGILSSLKINSRSKLSLNIKEEGTGFQSLLSMGLLEYALRDIVAHSRNPNVLFLIEEPEAFLHPQYQRYVANYVKELSEESQILLTTHSPIIIDSIEVSHVAKLIRNPKGLVWKWKNAKLAGEDTGRLSRFCDAKNSELIFAQKLILCEGITDVGVLRELLELYVEEDFYKANVSLIDMQSKDTAPHFVELAEMFSIPYLIIFDSDAILGDTKTLRSCLRKMNKPITEEINSLIRNAKEAGVDSFKKSTERRDKLNDKLENRNIFVLGGDIEYSVATSFAKEKVLTGFSKDNLGHFSNESVAELREKTGRDYYSRLRELMGSKGWNNERAIKDNKPKPYVLSQFMRDNRGKMVRGSDLSELKKRLKVFIKD